MFGTVYGESPEMCYVLYEECESSEEVSEVCLLFSRRTWFRKRYEISGNFSRI